MRAGDGDALQQRATGVLVAAEGRAARPGGAEGDEVAHLVAVGGHAKAAGALRPVQADLDVARLLGLQRGLAVLREALVQRGHTKRGARRRRHAPAGRKAVAIGHATGAVAAEFTVAVVPRVDLQRVRAGRVAVSQGDGVLVPALVDGGVGQVVFAPLQRRRDQVAAAAPFVLEQVVAQRGAAVVGIGFGRVALARFADRQARAVVLRPLRRPGSAQRAQPVVAAVVQAGREAVVLRLHVGVGAAGFEPVRVVQLKAQATAEAAVAVAVAVGVGAGAAVEAVADVARRAQRVIDGAAFAAEARFELLGAVVAETGADVGREGAIALLGEDLHHAGNGVGAVHRRCRAAHNFDALDLAERNRFPRRAATARLRIDPHAIDVDGGEAVLAPAHEQAGGGAGATVARQFQPRLALQQISDVDGAAALHLRFVQQRDVGQYVGQGLHGADGGDHGFRQLRGAELRHGFGGRRLRQRRQRAAQRQRQGGKPESGYGIFHDGNTGNTPLPASPPASGANMTAPRGGQQPVARRVLLVGRYPGWRRSLHGRLAFPALMTRPVAE